jgi:hypothetical protein
MNVPNLTRAAHGAARDQKDLAVEGIFEKAAEERIGAVLRDSKLLGRNSLYLLNCVAVFYVQVSHFYRLMAVLAGI